MIIMTIILWIHYSMIKAAVHNIISPAPLSFRMWMTIIIIIIVHMNDDRLYNNIIIMSHVIIYRVNYNLE